MLHLNSIEHDQRFALAEKVLSESIIFYNYVHISVKYNSVALVADNQTMFIWLYFYTYFTCSKSISVCREKCTKKSV